MKLARVLGGVALTHGRLGHQVLGQILITNLTQAEFAGAALIGSAGSRQRNVFAQAAINTAAPALALQALVDKADRRLSRREQELIKREGQLAQPSTVRAKDISSRDQELLAQREQIEALQQSCDGSMADIACLQIEKRELESRLEELRVHLETATQSALGSDRKLLAQCEQIEALQRSCDEATIEIADLENEKVRLEAQLARREVPAEPMRGWRSKDGKDT